MVVGMISRPSSITSQIPNALLKYGPWIVQSCPKLGFPFSKSKRFHPVFIKLSEYVGGHDFSTKFYNLPNPQALLNYGPWIVQSCIKLGFPLSKSKRFHQVFIKLSEYVGGHDISTKFYHQPNPSSHSWIMTLELSRIVQNYGFRSLSQGVFIRSSSNLVKMLVSIISQGSSITSQFPHALLNYGPWIVQN